METNLALTVDEFCRASRISKTTAYEEISAGRLVVAKVGSKTIVPMHRAEEWIRGREVAQAAPSRNPSGKRKP